MVEIGQKLVGDFAKLLNISSPEQLHESTTQYCNVAFAEYARLVRPSGDGRYQISNITRLGADKLISANYDSNVEKLVRVKLPNYIDKFIPTTIFYLLRYYHTLQPHSNSASNVGYWQQVLGVLSGVQNRSISPSELQFVPDVASQIGRPEAVEFAEKAVQRLQNYRIRRLTE